MNTSVEHAAADVNSRANKIIWTYFILLVIGLYATIAALTIYFRYEVEREEYLKVGSVPSKELLDYKADMEQVLSGQKGLIEGKKNISIDDAMNAVVRIYQGAPEGN